MTDLLIEHMVNRFLGWKLPEDFSPDAGISFKPTFNDFLPTPTKHNPVGTNLFTAAQAREMFQYVLSGFDLHAEDGGLAFPHHEVWDDDKPDVGWIGGGMSIRDYFAARAMEALMQMDGIQFAYKYREHAVEAYKQADAMLKARAARMEKENG